MTWKRGSSYFKSMLQLTTMEEIIEEIKNYADTLDVACLIHVSDH